ncbi:hypothetical protein BDV93DRAFT_608400 [Ceratobasidium sp. AG-I]|nr:hypothetical protein BDV93DRAFT_608400 [Ceratobasidium sp. AG-I]
MLRRNTPHKQTCHFCNTPVEKPHNVDFKCSACGSWNMFDGSGRLRSDHPAMHDESLNTDSFSKRASPNRNRLPSAFPANVFCHTCQTNQTLIINMLSNYLPPSSDPSYARLLAELPVYKDSLYARYPPVCARCQPAVDEQIGQKDVMARSSALGGWLEATRRNKSPGVNVGEATSVIAPARTQVVAWNIRGALWIGMTAWWIYIGAAASLVYPNSPPILPYPNPLISLASIFWQFWDPTWRTLQRAQLQGREARTDGKVVWIRCQGLIWITRFVFSGIVTYNLAVIPQSAFVAVALSEIIINFLATQRLRIVQPPRIRLVASSSRASAPPAPTLAFEPHRAGTFDIPPPQQPAEVPALSALSLSSFPTSRSTRTVNPIFGVASLPQSQAQPPPIYTDNLDSDAMDWTPATGQAREETTDWLRPARFAPEKPTGLEGLLEKFGIGGDEAQVPGSVVAQHERRSPGVGRGVVIGMLLGVGALAVAAGLAAQESPLFGGWTWRAPVE